METINLFRSIELIDKVAIAFLPSFLVQNLARFFFRLIEICRLPLLLLLLLIVTDQHHCPQDKLSNQKFGLNDRLNRFMADSY